MKINLIRFIYIFLGFHIAVYLCWIFVELSFITPLIETFKTSELRWLYLLIIFHILAITSPYYISDNEDAK